MSAQVIDSVVFDFDGTLASLTIDFDVMRENVAALAGEYLGSLPEHNGRAVLEWIQELAPAMGPGPEGNGFAGRAHALVRAMEMEAAGHGHVFPYTDRVLADLARRGLGLAVITRNCAKAVFAVHPRLGALVRAVLTRDHVARVKPDPAHLLDALKVLGTAPRRALMVGDHPMDILTGKRAGTLTAGVLSGSGREADLRAAGADLVAADIAGLLDLLTAEGLVRG